MEMETGLVFFSNGKHAHICSGIEKAKGKKKVFFCSVLTIGSVDGVKICDLFTRNSCRRKLFEIKSKMIFEKIYFC